jgi:hypothetical protein
LPVSPEIPWPAPSRANALAALRHDGADPAGLIASLAGKAVGDLADPDTIGGLVAVLVEELLAALHDLG